jgi:hypothetical protein
MISVIASAALAAASVTVDGKPVTSPQPVPLRSRIVMTNGRVRITLPTANRGQRAGHRMQIRRGGHWVEATARAYGDWTFVGSSVKRPPTGIRVIEASPQRVAVTWSFDRHIISGKYTSDGGRKRYPFTNTVWLLAGDRGYYSLVEPRRRLAASVGALEHEIGFGGVFGDGTFSYPDGSFSVSAATAQPQAHAVPWMQQRRDGDAIVRTLVPFPASEVIVPAWTDGPFGSMYVHRLEGGPYGAYLSAGPAEDPQETCIRAWRRAPEPLARLNRFSSCATL